ncbi:MAG: hypothetical protein MUC50_24350, partial [Myxococcota bacterium]|nr:hypothetical protein [Myxococcota bacterium]
MQNLMKNLLAPCALGTLMLLGSLGCETGDLEDENFLDDGQTQSPDDDMEPLAGATCADNSSFVDAQGYRCADWVGYDCTQAVEKYSYTSAQESSILANCPKSCNKCSTDLCPNDPNKTQPGQCGCGTPDTDSDGDGTANCKDGCPSDPKKTAPGLCGCGKAEGTCSTTCADNTSFVDAQGYKCSGWVGYDCTRAAEEYGYTAAQETQILQNCKKTCNQCSTGTDNCPNDPNKTEPGLCGCGVPEGTCSGSAYNVYYG